MSEPECPTCEAVLCRTQVGYACNWCGWEWISKAGEILEEVLEDERAYGGGG